MRLRPGLPLLLLAPALAVAQDAAVRAHMEGCLKWSGANGGYAAFNQCDTPIAIKFMLLRDSKIIDGQAAPGASFFGPAGGGGSMIFTACPVGYEPSLKFSVENAERISLSLYNCRPVGGPTS